MNKLCPIKVVEMAGTSITRKLFKIIPFGEEKFNSERVFCMFNKEKGNCKTENITYEIVCGKGDCVYI